MNAKPDEDSDQEVVVHKKSKQRHSKIRSDSDDDLINPPWTNLAKPPEYRESRQNYHPRQRLGKRSKCRGKAPRSLDSDSEEDSLANVLDECPRPWLLSKTALESDIAESTLYARPRLLAGVSNVVRHGGACRCPCTNKPSADQLLSHIRSCSCSFG